LVDCKDFKRIW